MPISSSCVLQSLYPHSSLDIHQQPEIPQVIEIYRWYDQGVSLIGMMEIHSDKIVERSVDFSSLGRPIPFLAFISLYLKLLWNMLLSLDYRAKKIILKFLYNRRWLTFEPQISLGTPSNRECTDIWSWAFYKFTCCYSADIDNQDSYYSWAQ